MRKVAFASKCAKNRKSETFKYHNLSKRIIKFTEANFMAKKKKAAKKKQ